MDHFQDGVLKENCLNGTADDKNEVEVLLRERDVFSLLLGLAEERQLQDLLQFAVA